MKHMHLALIAAALGAVYWFVLRKQGGDSVPGGVSVTIGTPVLDRTPFVPGQTPPIIVRPTIGPFVSDLMAGTQVTSPVMPAKTYAMRYKGAPTGESSGPVLGGTQQTIATWNT